MPKSASKVNVFLSPDYAIELSLQSFEHSFENSDKLIQRSRNTIKEVELQGHNTVVKSFKLPNAIQGFIYKFLRSSKARRSFEFADKLLASGINTPKPIGYIEVYSRWKLEQSYFIAELLDYDFEIRDVLDNKSDDKQRLLKEFAEFTYRFHQNNFLHLDYSTGNTLIKKLDNGYQFSVVDINRMRFGPVSAKEGMENFSRISEDPENIALFSEVYGKLVNLPVEQCKQYLNRAVAAYQGQRARKRKFKKLIGR